MYTSYIGKKFLQLYNQKENSNYSAKEFFDKVFFPVFFNDEKHLMHVGNSAFFQSVKEEDIKTTGKTKPFIQLEKLHNAVQNDVPNGSIFVGFAAKELDATTSAQVTSMDFKIDAEEIYASWLGQALAMGVSGGFALLIDLPEILLALAEGWRYYRVYLQQTPQVKDRQIETWNGHWICHFFSPQYDAQNPMLGLQLDPTETLGKISIPTKNWSKFIFSLAKKYPQTSLTAYVYNLSQMNTTIGFINLLLPQVRKPYEMRDRLFLAKEETILEDHQIEQMEAFYSFRQACMQGSIGLKALEPNKLRDFMPEKSYAFSKGNFYKFTSDNQSVINFNIYKIWIIAMLNKTELLESAASLARMLLRLSNAKTADNQRGKNTENRKMDDLLNARNVKNFIEQITSLIDEKNIDNEELKMLHETVSQVLKMPSDNFPLFITLVRFEYAYQSNFNQNKP